MGGLTALVGVFVLTVAVGIAVGSVPVPPGDIIGVVGYRAAELVGLGGEMPGALAAVAPIVWDLRLPRVLMAVLVGSGLAVAGAAFQALFRNPMADPFIIGVAPGGSLGAAIGIFVVTGAAGIGAGGAAGRAAGAAGSAGGALQLGLVPVFAFAGAMVAIVLVYVLAQAWSRGSTTSLLLAGIAVGAVMSALVDFLITVARPEVQRSILAWLAGGLNGRSWQQVGVAFPYIAAGVIVLLAAARGLNAISQGEETAVHLGVSVTRLRLLIVAVGSLVTAACVAVTGIIGFVGLVMPHLTRLLVGTDHRRLLPAAALLGATFVVLADTVGRAALAPLEIRVSIITALVGGPFFLFLLVRHRRGVRA